MALFDGLAAKLFIKTFVLNKMILLYQKGLDLYPSSVL
jgi:hypothetical protein